MYGKERMKGKKSAKEKMIKEKEVKKKTSIIMHCLKKMLIVFCYQFQFAPFSLLI